jgi:integrase
MTIASRHGRNNARHVVTAARMFLRYLAVEGLCAVDLANAIPRVAGWSAASLPRYLPATSVDRLIASCDIGTPIGMRDRAILLLLARLGLRPSDVVHLRLCDIDWSGARLCVTGKSRRESWLPLPQDVGDSICLYLEHGRPAVDDDHVFVRSFAPFGPFGGNSLNGVIRSAVQRSGIETPSCAKTHARPNLARRA